MNAVTLPMWTCDVDGAIVPNVIFHRPWDQLHSRCIEYPFAASQVNNVRSVLDVGTTKSAPAWIQWLASLDADIHATDYDPMPSAEGITFHQGDVRHLQLPDATFDAALAVSVIEHVGLGTAQTVTGHPDPSDAGDVEAVRELVRVLKPGGRLVMTLPFGVVDGLILDGVTRGYTANTITKFDAIAERVVADYYEYQHARTTEIYFERCRRRLGRAVRERITTLLGRKKVSRKLPELALPGRVTWRRVPMGRARATHEDHVDGIICGVWRKP